MKINRDDFSPETKRILGGRVAYRCSYSGCNIVTIGPDTANEEKVVNFGKAAHIHAAAPGGPRYLPDMTTEARKSIQNGIWMCGNHAWLIDANYGNYSAETLLQWKKTAEADAYRRLKDLEKEQFPDPTTIICLNPDLMFEGIWKSASNDTWTFMVKEFIYGDLNTLRNYGTTINSPFKHYIIIESQGDGRLIDQRFEWVQKDNELEICLKVFPSVIRRNPNHIGTDYATSLDGDLVIEAGDFKRVSGKELAKQLIETNLSIQIGSWRMKPRVGSLFTQYYREHRNDQKLLNRLVKIELTRLITIPIQPEDATDQPELSFINRIHEVVVMEELNGIVPVYVSLEWGDGTFWSDTLHVHLHPQDAETDMEFEEMPEIFKELFDQEPLAQMRALTAKLNHEELQEKINPVAILQIFRDVLPEIMHKADTALNTEVYPLFNDHILYRTFDNNTYEYNTSYDLEAHLYKRGNVQQLGVTISLKGFKKAGIKAFDVTSYLFIYFNDYNYVIGNSKTQPWLIKMYHKMPTTQEIERLCDQFINNVIKQINQQILESGSLD